MKIKLSDCEVNPKKIEALENYCKKNNKLRNILFYFYDRWIIEIPRQVDS